MSLGISLLKHFSTALTLSLIISASIILGGPGPRGYLLPLGTVVGIIGVYVVGRLKGFFSWKTSRFAGTLATAIVLSYATFLLILAIRHEVGLKLLLGILVTYVLVYNAYSIWGQIIKKKEANYA